MKIVTNKGYIEISDKIISVISGYAALNCFGVKGMTVRGIGDELVLLLKGENFHKGVKVRVTGNSVSIELHIAVEHGVNMKAVARSIITRSKYVVENRRE